MNLILTLKNFCNFNTELTTSSFLNPRCSKWEFRDAEFCWEEAWDCFLSSAFVMSVLFNVHKTVNFSIVSKR